MLLTCPQSCVKAVSVKATDHPEITLVTVENERFKDNVVIGGLLLCKAPKELVEERSDYYNSQTKSQDSADNNFMRENDPRMPLFNDRRSKVTFEQELNSGVYNGISCC